MILTRLQYQTNQSKQVKHKCFVVKKKTNKYTKRRTRITCLRSSNESINKQMIEDEIMPQMYRFFLTLNVTVTRERNCFDYDMPY